MAPWFAGTRRLTAGHTFCASSMTMVSKLSKLPRAVDEATRCPCSATVWEVMTKRGASCISCHSLFVLATRTSELLPRAMSHLFRSLAV